MKGPTAAIMATLGGDNHMYLTFNTLWVFMMLYGAVVLLYYVICVIDILMDLFVRSPISLDDFGAGQGKWAVVTGCTDGIGKEMALQLADKGFNIILLSRTPEKLEQVKQGIESKGAKAIAYAVDFASCSSQRWDEIATIINSNEVSVLASKIAIWIAFVVNNVGVCHKNQIFFDKEKHAACDDIVKVNVNSMMDITRIVVPQMQTRKNGLIINLGSFAAMRAMGFLSVYAASKSFIKTFSQSLAYELEPDGIMLPTYIAAGKPTLSIPSAETFVKALFDHLGLRCGAADSHTSIPYYPHAILNFITSCLWDPVLATPVNYSVANNLYQLGQQRQKRHATKEFELKNAGY
ncbi:hypothetical protein BX070DRAFT_235291 [Coemansia spiralis]|nr:hypothetical protein BX070DRAFT_235291 [Coemansia spiralis]